MSKPYLVPDLLAPGLKLVFCGTAPSAVSAREKAYYAHKGNRFWPTLYATGLTPRLFKPNEYHELLALGIGLTDLCKTASGNDDQLPEDAFDIAALKDKITRYQPKLLAFTSGNAASAFFGGKKRALGLQPDTLGATRFFILTSTSGANGNWIKQRHIWNELAACVRTL